MKFSILFLHKILFSAYELYLVCMENPNHNYITCFNSQKTQPIATKATKPARFTIHTKNMAPMVIILFDFTGFECVNDIQITE